MRSYRKQFIELYEAIDGISDEMSSRDHRLVNQFWPDYQEAKRGEDEDRAGDT